MWEGSVPAGRVELFHQRVDLAGGNRHDNSLDGADLFFGYLLFPGHAKVVLDSWLALPGHGSGQPDHGRSTAIEVFGVAHRVVEIAVGFMLFGGKHD